MRCFAILFLTLVAFGPLLAPHILGVDETVSASPSLPLAVYAGTEILRRQASTGDACGCDAVQTLVNACGKNDFACFCTASIAQGMQTCASCKLDNDPSQAQFLQTFLNQYTNGCQANGHAVGTLALTGSVASSLPTSTLSLAAGSSDPAAATGTSHPTRSGNSASAVSIQMASAFGAASMTVALSLL
ncbi:hypothetical protein FS837_012385 [Tulasnella sp. UAMH 9824]|nr:hypothetical protein FS837_012385 [Tulasnella sp. UAMH 9824]